MKTSAVADSLPRPASMFEMCAASHIPRCKDTVNPAPAAQLNICRGCRLFAIGDSVFQRLFNKLRSQKIVHPV